MATPTTLPASFTSGQVLTAAQMNNLRGAFRVLQTIQTVKKDTFSTASATFVDVTGLTATITPSATTNRVLIIASVSCSSTDGPDDNQFWRIAGGNATTYVGDAAGSRIQAAWTTTNRVNMAMSLTGIVQTAVFLDSPATTSATTYSVQVRQGNSGTAYVNRTHTDTSSTAYGRFASSITVMEISA